MRKFSIAFVLCLFLVGCGNTQPTLQQTQEFESNHYLPSNLKIVDTLGNGWYLVEGKLYTKHDNEKVRRFMYRRSQTHGITVTLVELK